MQRTLALGFALFFATLASCDSSPPPAKLIGPAASHCDTDASTCGDVDDVDNADDADDCIPDCEGRTCGDDGCGGDCGACTEGLECTDEGDCVCVPNCEDRDCGEDGCGGSCGSCDDSHVCSIDGNCLCVPDCDGKVCGDDGCGGDCGRCKSGRTCSSDGTDCDCVPDCEGKECGDDGCGGECGSECSDPTPDCNTRDGECVSDCEPDCEGRECGDDGCGGSCEDDEGDSDCDDGDYCSDEGRCECQPDCEGKQCGDDGCGGECGECKHGLGCSDDGQCDCTPRCDGKQCGHDGCGGSCGTCSDDVDYNNDEWGDIGRDHDSWHKDRDHDNGWDEDHDDWHRSHAYRNNICTWWGECVCIPYCGNRECGDDGCGGECGWCDRGEFCWGGQCGCTKDSCRNGFECVDGDCERETKDCQGPSQEACGNCGKRIRTCDTRTGDYGDWSECTGSGECAPNATGACGANSRGTHTCNSTCQWGVCDEPMACTGAAPTEDCGNCGKRSRTCNTETGAWTGEWTACSSEGACEPDSVDNKCGSNQNGSRTCLASCRWGTCVEPPPPDMVCEGTATRPCGNCDAGTQTRTCNPATGQWSDYGVCTGGGDCVANMTEKCGTNGERTCSTSCQWGTCMEQPRACTGEASVACGNCDAGTRVRTCNTDTGQWNDDGTCIGGGACSPLDTQACPVGRTGSQVCTAACTWSDADCTDPVPPATCVPACAEGFSCVEGSCAANPG